MAAATVRRPTAADPRRNVPFSSVFHRGTTPPPDPSSPTNSIGSTAGLIHRDERNAPLDLLVMMPNTLRDSSPGATQPQNVPNNPMNNNPSGPYEPTGISPANSLRRIPRENRGSSGSLNELGMHPQDLAAVGAAREKDRPSSRDRERKNTITTDKPEVRKASGGGGGPPNGSAPIRPSPYGFDSTGTLKANHSTTDLLSFGNLRDSPSFDNSALASLDPLKNDPSGGSGGGVGATASIPRKQGSGDSHELPKGEHGGWHTYDGPDPSASAQKGDSRNGEWDRKQANQAYTASRFSPDRFPLTEEQDGRDEEILSVPRTVNQQPKATQPSTSHQQPAQPRRRDLPGIPPQPQNTAPLHSRDHPSPGAAPFVPVPKTHHAQMVGSQWTRRPSSPLAREPVVANNSSSEETDTYTPRSPHAQLPDIPSIQGSSIQGSYVSNGSPQTSPQYSQQQSQPSPNVSQSHPQQSSNTRQMPPSALANSRRPPNQPYHEAYRGMPQMQLPMYTGASMATALSSISPSQSVSAVGSPRPRNNVPVGPPFGPSSVFIPESRTNGKGGQMYPMLGGQPAMKSSRHSNLNYSLDSQMAALAGQPYAPLNSANLAALKQLTANDLRALGFGKDQPPPPPQPAQQRPENRGQQNRQQGRVVDSLEKQAGEVVELQDLQRAMEMNLDQWDGREWGHNRPVHTGNSAQYPSSHAVLPPGDRAKAKAAEEYERQLQQLNALANNAYPSPQNHSRPGNPIPPTPFSSTGPGGQTWPRVLPNGEGWIPVPNTDGYPPSYGELMSLYEQHNPGKQPSMRDVLMMQLAALASEPENLEGSVFSKSETPFPPTGFNPFIQSQTPHPGDSARSSPRDPPGEFDKMLRRVGTFTQPPRRTVASSVFGGDGETEVSRMAPSTATEGTTMEDDDGTTTEDDTHSNGTAAAGGLRLNFDNSTSETVNGTNQLGMNPALNGSTSTINESAVLGGNSVVDMYPHLMGMLKSRAASVAPGFAHQIHQGEGSPWVEETDSDEDLEAELEVWGDEEGARLHPRFIRDESKRRRKWEIKFAELVKAFHELDRLTDTPMILLASPPRTALHGTHAPVSHIALSRSIKRDPGYSQRAHQARQSYHNILTAPPTPRSSYNASSPSLSPPLWGGPQLSNGWGSGSATSSDADAQMRAQMVAALSSLKLMNKVEERREERRRQEAIRQKDEREAVEKMLKGLLSGVAASSIAGSGKGSMGTGSPGNGSIADKESVRGQETEEHTPINANATSD